MPEGNEQPLISHSKHPTANAHNGPLVRTNSLALIKSNNPNTGNYLKNIKLRKHSVMYRGAMLNIPKYHLRASSCPDIYRNSMTTLAKETEEVKIL